MGWHAIVQRRSVLKVSLPGAQTVRGQYHRLPLVYISHLTLLERSALPTTYRVTQSPLVTFSHA